MRASRKLLTNGQISIEKRPPTSARPTRTSAPVALLAAAAAVSAVVLVSLWFGTRKHRLPAAAAVASPAEVTSKADPLKECMAWSEPGDPYATSDPDAESAFQACASAPEPREKDGAFRYQLGTAALFSGHMDEAQASLEEAARQGSCPALYFLGRKSWHDDQSVEAAAALYQRAADCGDSRARKELFDPEIFKGSAYPDYVAALYASKVEPLNKTRFLSASYVAGFYEAFSEQYLGKEFDPCWTTTYYKGGDVLYGIKAAEKGDASNILESLAYEKSLPILFHVLLPAQGSEALQEVRETARKAGHADALRLIRASHCGALLPYRIMEGIRAFAKARKSLLSTATGIYPKIHTLNDLLAYVRQDPETTAPAR